MRILIVDDEIAVRTVLNHHLRKYGSPFTVVEEASSGDELIEAVSLFNPDIVFTDIRMPGSSGLEALEEIRDKEMAETTSFYIMSGFSEFEYARTALRLRAEDYLLKPIRYAMVEKILQREERHRFKGVDPRFFHASPTEEALSLLSLVIQQMAETMKKSDWEAFDTLLEKWKELAGPLCARIDPEYFTSAFGIPALEDDAWQNQYQSLKAIEGKQVSLQWASTADMLRRLVEEHYTQPDFNLNKLADITGYSVQYLSLLCKRETGMTFSNLLSSRRLEKAKVLVETSSMMVKDICQACGYSHSAYFIKRFSQEYGMTPDGLRKSRNQSSDEV